jgi:multicomponent Na+:H+ antiporter subunit D
VKLLLVLPIVIPLLTTAVSLLAWPWRTVQRWCGVGGAVALCGVAFGLLEVVWRHGIVATQIGDWPAPFGITLVADLFSALMVLLAGIIGLMTTIYALAGIDRGRESFGYYPLLHVLLMGVCGAFLTGDLFNLYVWFEVMLVASFVLLALGGERAQIEGAIKYVAINLFASAMFLTAVGILYGMAGTLNMADLAHKLGRIDQPGLVTTLAMLFFAAFSIKAAAFPFFFWLPASYHTPPEAVSALFAGLLTKVGVYALIRSFTLLFTQDTVYTHTVILTSAGLTMLIGVLGAIVQRDLRRVLSFQVVSHIGYMLMGLGLLTPLGLAGSVFYMVHHMIVITVLFLVGGIVYRLGGTYDLRQLGGLYRAYPGVSGLFLLAALSLSGMPPLSGFIAKLGLVRAGLETQHITIVVIALGVGLLTLLSMTMVWAEVFWKSAPGVMSPRLPEGKVWLFLPIIGLVTLSVVLGLGAEAVFPLASRAADQLLHPVDYIQTVLGRTP